MNDKTVADGGLGPLSEPPPPGETLTFDTTLGLKPFLWLSLKNGLLNIVTLTLYRFWGKTEVRRRVWRGVRLNGDAFEYTGRGVELFIGFLMALLVLGTPFLIVVFGAQFLGPMIAALILVPLYLFIFWLWGFGTFTAFRYMASRTTWRGVRFRLGGSAVSYGFKYLGAMFLGGLSLGWFWPAATRGLAESVWDEVRFGDKRVRFRMARAQREGVYGAFALGWLLSVLPYVGTMFLIGFLTMHTAPIPVAGVEPVPYPPNVLVAFIGYGVLLAVAPIFLLIWAPYQAAMLRSLTAGITIDGAGFRLEVKALSLWWLTVSNLFMLLISLGFLMPWAQARSVRYIVRRLKSSGEARLDEARQIGTGPKAGEGLADAFGFSII